MTEQPPRPNMAKMWKESELEAQLYAQILGANLPMPDWQRPIKGHKVDFTWPSKRVMVEIQGGTAGYGRGRGAHVREPGYSRDRMYSNNRQREGWLVLEFTKAHIDSGEALELLKEVLAG